MTINFAPYGDTADLHGREYDFAVKLVGVCPRQEAPSIRIIELPEDQDLYNHLQKLHRFSETFHFKKRIYAVVPLLYHSFNPKTCQAKVRSWEFYRQEARAAA